MSNHRNTVNKMLTRKQTWLTYYVGTLIIINIIVITIMIWSMK